MQARQVVQAQISSRFTTSPTKFVPLWPSDVPRTSSFMWCMSILGDSAKPP